jgi:hypothetical protein
VNKYQPFITGFPTQIGGKIRRSLQGKIALQRLKIQASKKKPQTSNLKE